VLFEVDIYQTGSKMEKYKKVGLRPYLQEDFSWNLMLYKLCFCMFLVSTVTIPPGKARTVSVFVSLPKISASCLRIEEIPLKLSVILMYLQSMDYPMTTFVLKELLTGRTF
jgi:hypothetical protein